MLLEFQCPTTQVRPNRILHVLYVVFFLSEIDINCHVCVLFFFCVKLCVERCPDRYLTLVKAITGDKKDREYYKQYCKEGVDITNMVSRQIILLYTFYTCLK